MTLEEKLAELKSYFDNDDSLLIIMSLIRALEICIKDFEESDTPLGKGVMVNDGIRKAILAALEGEK